MPVTYEEICGFLDGRDIEFKRHDDGEILIQYHADKYRNPADHRLPIERKAEA